MVMFYGTELESRLMLGTSQYPSPAILEHAFKVSNASVATISLRREGREGAGQPFWDIIQQLGVKVLPNTAGCHSVKEAAVSYTHLTLPTKALTFSHIPPKTW